MLKDVKKTLDDLKDHRNLADYVMSDARLAALGSGQMIQNYASEVRARYTDWGL